MKTFTEFLNESRYQNLFHGTHAGIIEEILHTNKLLARYGDETFTSRGKAVSLTRSIDFAWKWAKQGTYPYIERAAIIEIDQNALRLNRIHPKPYNYYFHSGDDDTSRPVKYTEAEEFVPYDILDIKKYIVKIHVTPDLDPDEFHWLLSQPKVVADLVPPRFKYR